MTRKLVSSALALTGLLVFLGAFGHSLIGTFYLLTGAPSLSYMKGVLGSRSVAEQLPRVTIP